MIHRLYEITSDYEAGFDAQVRGLLAMGCERFELDIGILSRITGDRYEVVQAVAPPGVSLARGDSVPSPMGENVRRYAGARLHVPVGFALRDPAIQQRLDQLRITRLNQVGAFAHRGDQVGITAQVRNAK